MSIIQKTTCPTALLPAAKCASLSHLLIKQPYGLGFGVKESDSSDWGLRGLAFPHSLWGRRPAEAVLAMPWAGLGWVQKCLPCPATLVTGRNLAQLGLGSPSSGHPSRVQHLHQQPADVLIPVCPAPPSQLGEKSTGKRGQIKKMCFCQHAASVRCVLCMGQTLGFLPFVGLGSDREGAVCLVSRHRLLELLSPGSLKCQVEFWIKMPLGLLDMASI